MTATVPAPGWYPYGRAERVAEWDGQVWTGQQELDETVAAPPWRHRRPWALLTRLWFWLTAAGVVVSAAAGIMGDSGTGSWWVSLLVVGLLLTLSGIVTLFQPLMRFTELRGLPVVLVAGLVSGLVAITVANALEGTLEPHLQIPMVVDLWLAGVIEETCKIAVPVLLLIVARERFGDPRVGVLMVLISSAVFGVAEGIQYVTRASGTDSHMLMGLVRPLVEISHPLWATIAAGAIWLAAHRSGRIVTWVGFAGWFVAAALHSIHDGVLGRNVHGIHNHAGDISLSVTEAVAASVEVNAYGIVFAVVSFLILSHVLREIVPPTAVAQNPPHWRPRLALWGVPRARRTRWMAEQSPESAAPAPPIE